MKKTSVILLAAGYLALFVVCEMLTQYFVLRLDKTYDMKYNTALIVVEAFFYIITGVALWMLSRSSNGFANNLFIIAISIMLIICNKSFYLFSDRAMVTAALFVGNCVMDMVCNIVGKRKNQ